MASIMQKFKDSVESRKKLLVFAVTTDREQTTGEVEWCAELKPSSLKRVDDYLRYESGRVYVAQYKENQSFGLLSGARNSVYMAKKLFHTTVYETELGVHRFTTKTYGDSTPVFVTDTGRETWLFVWSQHTNEIYPFPASLNAILTDYYLHGTPINDSLWSAQFTNDASKLGLTKYSALVSKVGLYQLLGTYVALSPTTEKPDVFVADDALLELFNMSNTPLQWSSVPSRIREELRDNQRFTDLQQHWEKIVATQNPIAASYDDVSNLSETEIEHREFMRRIHEESIDLKPKELVMSKANWKYLIRTIERGKNLMIIGAKGTGKTQTVYHAAEATGRKLFKFNLGATQDARSSLIGNTHFDKTIGTYVVKSEFVHAIETPNAIVLLDELSRANPEAWNILMSVIDPGQRYLRMDESPDTPIVKVADGVCFIATANIGPEYTATRVMDMALVDRFSILEMERLTEDETVGLLDLLYPKNGYANKALGALYGTLLMESAHESGKVNEPLSMRAVIEAADLMHDGFSLSESAEVSIYPYYSNEGADSPRVFVKQCVQKFGTIEVYGNNRGTYKPPVNADPVDF